MSRPWFETVPPDAHWLLTGGTRRGKSGLLQLQTRFLINTNVVGLTAVDPHGSYVRAIIDWLANPLHGQIDRDIHILDPASGSFGLNPLELPDTSWESCHLAANTLASIVESRFEASPEQTPRLSRLVYVAAMLCARRKLTLIELVEVLSLAGDELRRSLLSEFGNDIVRHELEELHTLAAKQPARFLELVESTKNRFIRLLGDPRLRCILGQRHGLNPCKLMDARSIILADFSSLNYSDAAFLGCILSSMFFSAARYRKPMACAPHKLILDEAESLLTVDVARMCDQSAKMGLTLLAAIQRLGQLRARGDFLADALMTNCAVKVCFGGLEPMSARYMAETFFTGFIDFADLKLGTERPVAIGSQKTIVTNHSTAHHLAEHEATGETESIAHGTARSRMVSVTEADGTSESEGTNMATAQGAMDADSLGSASSSFDGLSTSISFDPNSGGLFMLPPVLGANSGTSQGTGLTSIASSSSGRSSSATSGSSRATTSSHTTAVTEAIGTTESEVRGSATSRTRGTSRGVSTSDGESETFIAQYEWLPAFYSLEEQLHRLTGELIQLPRRECFVKIEDQRPFRTRTADLTPAFQTPIFKRIMLPVFLESVARRSPYLLTHAAAESAIAARLDEHVPSREPEPDFAAAETVNVIDDHDAYAKEFFDRHSRTYPKSLPFAVTRKHGDNDND